MTERLCIPIEQWPSVDQELWIRATSSGGLLDDGGLASDWRPDTRLKVAKSYGRFLRFLRDTDMLDEATIPADRATREVIGQYVDHLRDQIASKTLAGRITDLGEAIRVMCPGSDIGYLRRLSGRLGRAVLPARPKHTRLVPIADLYQLGFDLMERSRKVRGPRPCSANVMFRDGLMIALLAARPFRLRTFTHLRIGRHLTQTDDGYQLHIHPEDNKGKIADIYPVPAELTQWIDHYLDDVRPSLLKKRPSDRLWVSWEGQDLSECGLHEKIEERTKAAIGHAINPHLFRDCAATSIAIEDPEHVRIIRSILGHNTFDAGERFYNQAESHSAQQKLMATIQEKRKQFLQETPR